MDITNEKNAGMLRIVDILRKLLNAFNNSLLRKLFNVFNNHSILDDYIFF